MIHLLKSTVLHLQELILWWWHDYDLEYDPWFLELKRLRHERLLLERSQQGIQYEHMTKSWTVNV